MTTRRPKSASRRRPKTSPAAPLDTPDRAPMSRKMYVVARDPALRGPGPRGRQPIVMAEIEVPYEPLDDGPEGYRVRVVDYDAHERAYRRPGRSAEAPPKPAWRRGDPSLLSDPDFRAQHVYALVMRTLARFESALGRRVGWAFANHQIYALPHAFADANAFYDRRANALLFGSFYGSSGTTVQTCLSHDIVVHEATHALLDGLRTRYLDAASPDQPAFHEGFADVVALLSVFSMPEVVREVVRELAKRVAENRSRRGAKAPRDLIPASAIDKERLRQSALFRLAQQFRAELGDADALRGQALRQSLTITPAADLLQRAEYQEEHRRGEIFVAAVMHTFLDAWVKRLATLGKLRSEQGESGVSLARIVEEGAALADHLLTLWIRALDYMPPVDLRFGDALAAALLADAEVNRPDERFGCRQTLRDTFAEFGIEPSPQSEDWSVRNRDFDYGGLHLESLQANPDEVYRFLWNNMERLQVDGQAYCRVISVRPCTRVGPDGFVVRETVAEYYQTIALSERELRARAGDMTVDANEDQETTAPEIPVSGGGALIFDEFGRLKYHIAKRLYADLEGRVGSRAKIAAWRASHGELQVGSGNLAHLHRLRGMRRHNHTEEQW